MSEAKQEAKQEVETLVEELEALRSRIYELEDIEVERITEDQERFDALHVLDEYAQQLEETRDKLARLLRAGSMVQEADTVEEVLQRVADAIGEAGWGSVSVNLFDNFRVVQAAYYQVSAEDIAFLESNRRSPEDRARSFGPEFDPFKVSRSYFVPAERISDVIQSELICPGRREVEPGDEWDPMDLAYVPMYGTSGQVIGVINCDDPVDGDRPTQETFLFLELFADLAARKVEMVGMLVQQSRIEAALRESEQKYRTLFDRSGDGFFLMDDLFRDCNRRACEIFCCERGDIVGHSPAELSPEFQPDGISSKVKAGQYIERALKGEPQIFEWVHKAKTGNILYCEVSLAAVEISGGKKILAIVRDLTESKRDADEKETISIVSQLFLAAASLDAVYSQLPEVIADRCQVSMVAIELYDRERNEAYFVGRHGLTSRDWDRRIDLADSISCETSRTGKPVFKTVPSESVEHQDSRFMDHRIRSLICVPLRSNMQIIGSLILTDETERTNLSNSMLSLQAVSNYLAQSIDRDRVAKSGEELKSFYMRLLDNLSSEIAVIDPDGTYQYVNRAAVSDPIRRNWLIGKTDEEYFKQYGLPEDTAHHRRERLQEAIRARTVVRYEETLIDDRGVERHSVRILTPVFDERGELEHVVGYGMDVTQRVRAESEGRRIAVFPDLNPNIVLSFSLTGELRYRNPAAEKHALDLKVSDITGILPPQHASLMQKLLEGRTEYTIEHEDPDGALYRWSYRCIPDKSVVNVYAVDIGSRSNSSKEADQIVELIGPVLVLNENGDLIERNRAADKLLSDLKLDDPLNLLPDNYSALIQASIKEHKPFSEEVIIGGRCLRWQAAPSRHPGRICLVATELTEFRSLEEKLRHAQKMESVGRLTSGVAHDFNNLLTGIVGNIDLARDEKADEAAQQSHLTIAAKSAERAMALVGRLLSFTKQHAILAKSVDANEVCRNVIDMLSSTIDRRIELTFASASEFAVVYSDSDRLEQILMNLCVNAVDAILERIRTMTGSPPACDFRISLATALLHKSELNLPDGFPQSEKLIRISVEDNGCGIEDVIRPRILEPYFTTKTEGEGTGLGLSTVNDILQKLGGYMETSSTPGAGSTFSIYLPAAVIIQELVKTREITKSVVRGGSEKILLVDDEEMILDLGTEILELYGYTVLRATDGCEAAELFKCESDAIDLVILDICMPKMTGDEVLPLLLEVKPDLRVILSSGYGQNHVGHNINLGSIAYLNKPYRPSELAAAVRDVLDYVNQ